MFLSARRKCKGNVWQDGGGVAGEEAVWTENRVSGFRGGSGRRDGEACWGQLWLSGWKIKQEDQAERGTHTVPGVSTRPSRQGLRVLAVAQRVVGCAFLVATTSTSRAGLSSQARPVLALQGGWDLADPGLLCAPRPLRVGGFEAMNFQGGWAVGPALRRLPRPGLCP